MSLKVLTDFHHAGLLNSLILLFENRLDGRVYRPIGRKWYDEGFWKVYEHPATVEQFLGIGGATPDNTPRLNEVATVNAEVSLTTDYVNEVMTEPIYIQTYNCYDIDSGKTNRAIEFDEFLKVPFDIVIASIPQHIEPFKRLCELHPNKPKLIYQIGNAWTIEAGLAPNVMASAIINDVPENINFVSYHQEFSLEEFSYTDPAPSHHIYSFVNVFDGASHFASDWLLFRQVEDLMPEWTFRAFGGQCRDGAIHGSANVAKTMAVSRFIWHTKAGGDGYGHIIHNAPAMGRPLIVKAEYYRGKMAEPLLIDGQTAIFIDGLSPVEIMNKIEYYNEPERYNAMSRATYDNFKKVVDFDAEELKIIEFLAKLV